MKVNKKIGKELRKILISCTDQFTDKKILEFPTFVEIWKANTKYEVGKRVIHEGIIYKVLIEHTSQETWTPDVSPSLFAKVLIPNEDVIPEWEQPDSTNAYMKGDKVSYKDEIFISIIDYNVWAPDQYGWETLK